MSGQISEQGERKECWLEGTGGQEKIVFIAFRNGLLSKLFPILHQFQPYGSKLPRSRTLLLVRQ